MTDNQKNGGGICRTGKWRTGIWGVENDELHKYRFTLR